MTGEVGVRSVSNSVSVTSNLVSAIEIRILKIRDQRLARKNRGSDPNILNLPIQRQVGPALTRGSLPLFFLRTGNGAQTRQWLAGRVGFEPGHVVFENAL